MSKGVRFAICFQVIVIVRQKLLACQCLFPVAEINRRSVFGKGFIWIAVQPAFAWLRGGDHRVPAGVRMFGGVLIRRTVAAQCYPTCLARSQMHPVVARFYALFAFETLRLFDGSDRVEMRTASGGHDSFTGLAFVYRGVAS